MTSNSSSPNASHSSVTCTEFFRLIQVGNGSVDTWIESQSEFNQLVNHTFVVNLFNRIFVSINGGKNATREVADWLRENCLIETQGRAYIFYVQLIGEIVIAVLSTVSNSAVLVSIATYPSLQTVTNYFVASLSTADLFVGLIGIPCVIAAMNQLPADFSGCLTVNTMIVILTQISIFSLLVIAVERFYAIKYPFEYSRICTPKKAFILIAMTWVLSVLITLLPSFAWNLDKMPKFKGLCNFTDVFDLRYMVFYNFFGCVLSPLIVMIVIYCYIFSVVVRQIRSIEASQLRPRARSSVLHQRPKAGVESQTCEPSRIKFSTYDIDAFKRLEEENEDEGGGAGKKESSDEVILDARKLEGNGGTTWKDLQVDEPSAANNVESRDPGKLPKNRKVSFAVVDDATENRKQSLKKSTGSKWSKDIKAAKWFSIVLLSFIISWIPLHILNCMTVINGIVNFELLTFAILLSHLNSAFNPVLYALGNKKFSIAIKKLLNLKSAKVQAEEFSEY
uniref:A2 n=1 Tax=Hirudo verbana TaxID=311461 RepID=A0A346D5P2_9ANNE|nr:A2 [Hirudo verbana]